jgi:predicted metalloprotease
MALTVRDRVRFVAVLMILMVTLVPAGTVSAQDERTASVTAAAIEVSRLEASGDLLLLHDLLHPDARLLVSRAALKLWYEGAEAVIPSADPEVLSVEFGAWTWPVTGRTYADVATVQIRQRGTVGGAEVEQVEIQHYWYDGARWRWFFGADTGFVDGLRQQVGQNVDLGQFQDLRYAQVNQIWLDIYGEAGAEYRSPDAVNIFSELDLPVQTGCGMLTLDDYSEAFYCELDQEIYLMTEFEDIVERQFGEFAWHYAIAHEWGHHIQFLEGIDTTENPELDEGFYTIEVELQADCLAGVFTQEAIARGWATEADLTDAHQLAIFIGDMPDTTFDDPSAHGTGEQRLLAFTTGLEDGVFGCNLLLDPAA